MSHLGAFIADIAQTVVSPDSKNIFGVLDQTLITLHQFF